MVPTVPNVYVEPFRSVRYELPDYRLRDGLPVVPEVDVVGRSSISADGVAVNQTRLLPSELNTTSDFRWLPGASLTSTEWQSQEASNVKFIYPAATITQYEHDWTVRNELIEREAARLTSSEGDYLSLDATYIGTNASYGFAMVFRPMSGNNKQIFSHVDSSALNGPFALLQVTNSGVSVYGQGKRNEHRSAVFLTSELPSVLAVYIYREGIRYAIRQPGYTARWIVSTLTWDEVPEWMPSLVIGGDIYGGSNPDMEVYEMNLWINPEGWSTSRLMSICRQLSVPYGITS